MPNSMPISRAELVAFLREVPLLTLATLSPEGAPQAALLGVAVSDDLELVLDTLETTRKFRNIRRDPRVAFVFGKAGGYKFGEHDERTLQYEGLAEIPAGEELKRAQTLYFGLFPEGRERLKWPHITYIRARPTWIRFSDYNRNPPLIAELGGDDLREWIAAG
ncbi:MAG TPA: pyridoxamine 5'-phosphate oxidase family protein [Candidatus Acidoferrales bacterium]|nr:pyridoxamine 5'-phosphate oxidase family protein [Candidatus Acidoferrales bacterium]